MADLGRIFIKGSIINILRRKHIKIDLLYKFNIISFGIDMGSNKFIKNKTKNFFIEISVLFFTLGVEIVWESGD